jgi:hypothetical protein
LTTDASYRYCPDEHNEGSRPHEPSAVPQGATAREIQAVQHLHHVADRHKEPEVRQALSGAVEPIVELIEERGRRREFEDQVDDARADD